MRFLIGIIGFYSTIFGWSLWGWEAAVLTVLGAVLLDWLWRDHIKTTDQKRRKDSERKKRKTDNDIISMFAEKGCTLLRDGSQVAEFEHLHDLARFLPRDGSKPISSKGVCVVQTGRGFFAAYKIGGWPTNISKSDVAQVFDIHKSRNEVCLVPRSSAAEASDERKRQSKIAEVEHRIERRSRNLVQRLPQDLGQDATAVYIMSVPNNRSCKIGVTDNPNGRLASLQTGNSRKLKLSHCYWLNNRSDALTLENVVHNQLNHLRLNGEWFRLDPEKASSVVVSVFNELAENRVLECSDSKPSRDAVYSELLHEFCEAVSWMVNKKGNYTSYMMGERVTVFKRGKKWSWVRDGEFSQKSFQTAREAQDSAVRAMRLPKSEMLKILLHQ